MKKGNNTAAAAAAYSTATEDDAANHDTHFMADYRARDAHRAYNVAANLGDVIRKAINEVRGEAEELDTFLSNREDMVGAQPYGEEYIRRARRDIDNWGAVCTALESVAASADQIAKAHSVKPEDSLLELSVREILYGCATPTTHAQLVRAMRARITISDKVYADHHETAWGVVGGWRWSAERRIVVDSPGTRSSPRRVCFRAFLSGRGLSKVQVYERFGNQYAPEKSNNLHSSLKGILTKKEITLLHDWAYYGCDFVARKLCQASSGVAPSEATTAKIAAALSIAPTGEKQ